MFVLVPLVSRILPSDICKIHKRGSSIRLDTTLVDFNDMRWERGDITFLLNGQVKPSQSLAVLDNKSCLYQRVRYEVCRNCIYFLYSLEVLYLVLIYLRYTVFKLFSNIIYLKYSNYHLKVGYTRFYLPTPNCGKWENADYYFTFSFLGRAQDLTKNWKKILKGGESPWGTSNIE